MKFLKSLVVCIVLAIVTLNVSARQSAPMDAKTMTNNIKQNVSGMTPDQESKILAAEQEFINGMQDARSSSNGDRDAMRSKMAPIRATRESEIKAILNAEQYAQYQKYQKINQSHRGGGQKSN